MKVFKQVNFKRRYDVSNIVAVVADELPTRFSADVFKETTDPDALSGLTQLYAEYQNGQRIEVHGYL